MNVTVSKMRMMLESAEPILASKPASKPTSKPAVKTSSKDSKAAVKALFDEEAIDSDGGSDGDDGASGDDSSNEIINDDNDSERCT